MSSNQCIGVPDRDRSVGFIGRAEDIFTPIAEECWFFPVLLPVYLGSGSR